jgi:hypothetical protein
MTSAFKLRGVECPLTIQTSTPLPTLDNLRNFLLTPTAKTLNLFQPLEAF